MNTPTFKNSIEFNLNIIKNALDSNSMIVYREFENNEIDNVKFCVIYDHSMANTETISSDIIRPILYSKKIFSMQKNELCHALVKNILIVNNYRIISDVNMVIDSILEGEAVLLVDNATEAIVIQAKNYEKRSISEPTTQITISGPAEGFIEDLDTNISLLRRRLLHKDFKVNRRKIGRISKTEVAICYIEGLCSKKIIDEVNERLDKIDIDGILGSNYINELIADSPLSIFRSIGISERPDAVTAKILEGRLAIMVNGTRFGLTLPFLFVEYLQNSEDYHENYVISNINRIVRIAGFHITTSLPAVYIALTNYHQEFIPTNLAMSIAVARNGVPFPSYMEILLYLFIFEILREASTRIPTAMGQAIGVLGALVIGQSAVMAKLVSVPAIILVALTGITGLLTIELKGPAIVLRTIFIFSAMLYGLYGFIFALCGFIYYLSSLRSFGVPYMLHCELILDEHIKDTIIRAPWKFMKFRPRIVGKLNRQRQQI